MIVLAFAVSSCNTTKHVPEGSYLVNDVKINVEGDEMSRKELHNYLRQTPNHEILGGLKFQLGIYNCRAATRRSASAVGCVASGKRR